MYPVGSGMMHDVSECLTPIIIQYTIFFIAVQHWLDNPRHYEVTRDIGELLRRTKYADGINLSGVDDYDEEEDPTFPDDDDDDGEQDYNSGDDEPTQADLDFIDDGPVEDGEEDAFNFYHGQDFLLSFCYHDI
jgi:hypothetical protein